MFVVWWLGSAVGSRQLQISVIVVNREHVRYFSYAEWVSMEEVSKAVRNRGIWMSHKKLKFFRIVAVVIYKHFINIDKQIGQLFSATGI